jgi:hypothetical protein
MSRRGRAVLYRGLKWAARRPARIRGSSEFGRKDIFADNFDAAYGTWLHPGTKKPYSLDHWFMREADFTYVTDAAVNSSGVPKTDHRLVRLDLVFKFMPRRQRAVKPRIDRILLEDQVLKLKFQNSVADFIDAAQKGQYAALTTQFPSMVAYAAAGHPGTEFAPSPAETCRSTRRCARLAR